MNNNILDYVNKHGYSIFEDGNLVLEKCIMFMGDWTLENNYEWWYENAIDANGDFYKLLYDPEKYDNILDNFDWDNPDFVEKYDDYMYDDLLNEFKQRLATLTGSRF